MIICELIQYMRRDQAKKVFYILEYICSCLYIPVQYFITHCLHNKIVIIHCICSNSFIKRKITVSKLMDH